MWNHQAFLPGDCHGQDVLAEKHCRYKNVFNHIRQGSHSIEIYQLLFQICSSLAPRICQFERWGGNVIFWSSTTFDHFLFKLKSFSLENALLKTPFCQNHDQPTTIINVYQEALGLENGFRVRLREDGLLAAFILLLILLAIASLAIAKCSTSSHGNRTKTDWDWTSF